MAQGNFEPRTGHPVNDPEPLVRWLDLIQQYLNRVLFYTGTALNLIVAGVTRFTIDSSSATVYQSSESAFISDGTNTCTIRLRNVTTGILTTLTADNTLGFTITASGGISQSYTILPAGTTSNAPLRIPHGSPPTSPVNGDIWTTTAGLYVQINGVTVGPLS